MDRQLTYSASRSSTKSASPSNFNASISGSPRSYSASTSASPRNFSPTKSLRGYIPSSGASPSPATAKASPSNLKRLSEAERFEGSMAMPDTSTPYELEVQLISDDARQQFANILDRVEGKKDIVIQQELLSLLDHVTPISFLKKLGVDQLFHLEGIMKRGGDTLFYITRPDLLSTTWIAQHIQNDRGRQTPRSYHVIFVPRKLETCDFILENEGVHGNIEIHEWGLHLIPLDAHLLSLERFDTFKNLYIDQDFNIHHSIAKSLIQLEDIFGTIPLVHGKGHNAQMVWDLFVRLKEIMKMPSNTKEEGSDISEVILLDRQCDLVTPLCSQLTYEGILDDVLNIKSGYVYIPKTITGKKQDSKVLVNSTDPVFGVIRSLHFSSVPITLSAITKSLKTSYTTGKSLSSIPELKTFVQKLPELTKKHDSLSTHVKVSEYITDKMKRQEFQRQLYFERAILEVVEKTQITDYIEECIQRQMPIHIPLRLMCLMSTTNNGIKPKYFLPLKRAFLHSYGHKHMLTFHNLFKVGLLQLKEEEQGKAPKSMKQLSKQLKLVPKDPGSYDVHSLKDMSYVYGGAYKPLSCAVVEYLVRNKSWKGLDDIVKTWYGPAFTHVEKTAFTSKKHNRVILVYFIGGVTFSEVNALQSLGKKTGATYIVATSNIMNPCSLVKNTLGDMQ